MSGRVMRGLMALAVLWAAGVQAGEFSVTEALERASHQRMLTQRIVKAYAQVGLEVAPEVSAAQLRDSVAEFDANLVALRKFAPTPTIRGMLARMTSLWTPFRSIATGPVTVAGAKRLHELDGELLDSAELLTQLVQERAVQPIWRSVNASMRQRMLSERLAKLYMLRAYEADAPGLERHIAQAQREFEEGLVQLQTNRSNTYDINRELEAVTVQWGWFKSALEQEGDYTSFQVVVADASETMLYSMDHLIRLYAQLSHP